MQTAQTESLGLPHRRASQLSLEAVLQTPGRHVQGLAQIDNTEALSKMVFHPVTGLRHEAGSMRRTGLLAHRSG